METPRRSLLYTLLVCAACCGLTAAARAQSAPPFDLGAAYTADLFAGRRWAAGLHHLNVSVGADLGRGFAAYASLLAHHGESPTERLGDFQVVSNIDAPRVLRPYEAWIMYTGAAGGVQAGLYDLNADFYASESAALLLNSAFGIGPDLSANGAFGPSIYPFTALGVRVQAHPAPGAYLQAAALDAVPGHADDPAPLHFHLNPREGALLIAEGGLAPTAGARRKLGLGLWTFTQPVPGAAERASGAYALGEVALSAEAEAPSLFGRAGAALGEASPVALAWGAGVLWPALRRPRGAASFGVAAVHGSDAFHRERASQGPAARRPEIALEATYAFAVTGNVRVQPDLQLVLHPGMTARAYHAWTAALRLSAGL